MISAIVLSYLMVIIDLTNAGIGSVKDNGKSSCGQSTNSTWVPRKCFKYHPDKLDKINQAPWVARIKINVERTPYSNFMYSHYVHHCTGTLISDNWILTAGSCFAIANKVGYQNRRVKIQFTGHSFAADSWPDIISYFNPDDNYDYSLALIKLEHPVDLKNGTYDYINTICLPRSGAKLTDADSKDSFTAKWNPELKNFTVVDHKLGTEAGRPDLIRSEPSSKKNGSKLCMDDIGSPIWQIEQGSAVLVGVQVGVTGDVGQQLCSFGSLGIFLPKLMDQLKDKMH